MKRNPSKEFYDMHDSEKDMRAYPELRHALEECRLIEERFLIADEAAILYQGRHKIIVAVAAVGGTLAVVLAILQLTIASVPNEIPRHEEFMRLIMIAEGVAVMLAAGAVLWGAFGRVHQSWLEHRHRAERYRLGKFSSLIDPGLLSLQGQGARDWARKLEALMAEVANSSAHDWAVEENPHNRPPVVLDSKVSGGGLKALIDYYFQKRLRVQKRYFGHRSRRHDKSNWYTRLPPPLLFFASVLFALLHVLIEGIMRLRGNEAGPHLQQESVTAIVFIAAAAILPVCGGGIRTARAAFEFSRHTLRFRAKYNTLSRLEESLETHKEKLAQPKANGQEESDLAQAIYGDLWMCEHVLESEQREWLRLMIEAEWFA